MASQAVRGTLTSPARAVLRGSTNSILKHRPTALPLSPTAQASSFSGLSSPGSQRAIKSPFPRVRFPASPSKLVATISTYACDTYDRVPISVSPNPVALPGWGERVYSPSIDGFRLIAAPNVFRALSMTSRPSPAVTEFEDPRSPRLQPSADVTGSKSTNAIRVARMAVMQEPRPIQTTPLEKALTSYPRSPYPSAAFAEESDVESDVEARGRQLPRTANEISGAARARARAQSREARLNSLGQILGRPNGSEFAPVPSPLSQTFLTTTPSHSTSLNRANKPAPLALESDSGSDQLSKAFWKSVSIDAESADQPMVTALEYPESAIEYEERIDMDIRSAAQPPLMFAGADGVLFSPGLPKPHARVERLRESLQQVMSPGVKRTSFTPIARKVVTAPSPNDPFATFPSFGAVLEKVGLDAAITFPPQVVQRA